MIDDSDVDFAELAWIATPTGCLGSLVFIAIIIALVCVAAQNKDECATKHCDVGKPTLAHHECVCETLAK
jgi:hypothetical protein